MIEELKVKVDAPIGEIIVPNRDYEKPKWWHKLLRIPEQEKQRAFTIYKVRVCNIDRVAIVAESLPELSGDINTLEELTGVTLPLVRSHAKDYCYLLACFIHNKSTEPPKELIKYLYDNLTNEELFDYVNTCLVTSGLMSFMNATLLIKGTSVRIAGVDEAKVAPNATTQG